MSSSFRFREGHFALCLSETSNIATIVIFLPVAAQLYCGARLSRQKPVLEASPENSSEDLVANDLSENDVADDDEDDVDGCDN